MRGASIRFRGKMTRHRRARTAPSRSSPASYACQMLGKAPGFGETQQDGLRQMIGVQVAPLAGVHQFRGQRAGAMIQPTRSPGKRDLRKTADQNRAVPVSRAAERRQRLAFVTEIAVDVVLDNRDPLMLLCQPQQFCRASSGSVAPMGFWKFGVTTNSSRALDDKHAGQLLDIDTIFVIGMPISPAPARSNTS